MDNMISFSVIVPSDIQKQLAADVRHARLFVKDWKRETLSEKSGVPISTIKRFESSGEISLRQLLMLIHALGLLNRLDQLLKVDDVEGMSMNDYIKQNENKARKRGKK